MKSPKKEDQLHAVVCIKQVPETTEVRFDPETNTMVREGVPGMINPFDEYAIEEALLTKERFGGKVTVLSMGPPQAAETLRKTLAMGVDQAVLVTDRAFAGADTLATSYTLAMAIRKLAPVDIVFCGRQAIDGDTGQVGPGVAHRLGISQLTSVSKVKNIDWESGRIEVERLLESGIQVIESPLPALLTVVKDINQPRLPSLLRMKRAKQAEIPTWNATDIEADPAQIGLEGSPTQVIKTFSPPKRTGGQRLSGEPEEMAKELVDKLFAAKII
jgi:electron transfer flavoprotein beta subunit